MNNVYTTHLAYVHVKFDFTNLLETRTIFAQKKAKIISCFDIYGNKFTNNLKMFYQQQ